MNKKQMVIGGAVLAFAAAALISHGGEVGSTAGSGSDSGTDTVATEQTLCADLRANAATEVVYADANAVNEDMTASVDHDLVIEVLAYIASVDGYGLKTVEWETDKLLDDCAAIGL
jgi:hypothetical protein